MISSNSDVICFHSVELFTCILEHQIKIYKKNQGKMSQYTLTSASFLLSLVYKYTHKILTLLSTYVYIIAWYRTLKDNSFSNVNHIQISKENARTLILLVYVTLISLRRSRSSDRECIEWCHDLMKQPWFIFYLSVI